MEIQKIIDNLTTFDGKYKRDEIEEALSNRDEIIPALMEILQRLLENPEKYSENSDYFGHIYAVMLLGHFKEKRAHEVILRLFSLQNDQPYRLFGDVVTENLPVILLRTCDGNFEGIKKFILNNEADEYCRGSGLRAMTYGVVDGSLPRDEVLLFFRNILENRRSEQPSHFFDQMASCICDLFPQELMDLVKECYDDGYLHPGYIGLESFESALKAGKETCLKNLQESLERDSLEDIHAAMSWWACFDEGGDYGDYLTQQNRLLSDELSKRADKKKNKNKKKMIKSSKRKNRKKK